MNFLKNAVYQYLKRDKEGEQLDILLGLIIGFVLSLLTLYVIVTLFGTSKLDFKTIAAGALAVNVVSLLSLIPGIGWILAAILNIVIVMNLLECSALLAIFAIIIWNGLQVAVVMFLGIGFSSFAG